jgi:L-aspartate oxidase
MAACAGPIRAGAQLAHGLEQIEQTHPTITDEAERLTCANAALTARLIMASALLRRESRGGHFRSDFPQSQQVWQAHLVLQADHPPTLVPDLAGVPALDRAG